MLCCLYTDVFASAPAPAEPSSSDSEDDTKADPWANEGQTHADYVYERTRWLNQQLRDQYARSLGSVVLLRLVVGRLHLERRYREREREMRVLIDCHSHTAHILQSARRVFMAALCRFSRRGCTTPSTSRWCIRLEWSGKLGQYIIAPVSGCL